jgi:hypothetical protein
MNGIAFLDLFQGIATLFAQEPKIAIGRIVLMLLGFLLVYLGKKEVLEPLLMIPMGLGMSAVNAGVLFLDGGKTGTIFVDPLVSSTDAVMNILQIDWLQPIYTMMFSNGLIACLVFMGIGVLLDVGFVMARPFQSMILALFAELGTVLVFPDRVMARHDGKGSGLSGHHRRCRRPDGAVHLADAGQGPVRADHRGWLSLPRPDLRRLPLPDQAADPEAAPRHRRCRSATAGQDHRRRS